MTREVFFYGLFMDMSLLESNGLSPAYPKMGYLKNYALKIGNRASLIPSAGQKAYGLVITVDAEALRKLYAEASVADYLPETVSITLVSSETIPAMCYNLPAELLAGTNPAYAQKLYALATRLGFPEDYLVTLEQMT